VHNDPLVPQATKDLVVADAEQSGILTICQDLCNGTNYPARRWLGPAWKRGSSYWLTGVSLPHA